MGGSSHTLITSPPSTTKDQIQPPQMFSMGYSRVFQPFIQQGFASQAMISNPTTFIVADDARINPPQNYQHALPTDLGFNDDFALPNWGVEPQSPQQVAPQLTDFDDQLHATQECPTPTTTASRRGGRLTAQAYHRHLLRLDLDASASSSMVHLSFKQELKFSISCMDILILLNHTLLHTPL